MANSRLTRTISSAGSLTTWTFSTWIKRSMLGDSDTIMAQGSSGDNFMEIHFDGNDCLDWRQYVSGAYQGRLQTNRRLQDMSAWYHIVCQWDTTNGTAGDRMKMWINGVQETSFQATTNPTSSRASVWNSTTGTMNIGSAWNAAYYFNGYQSHTAFVNGAIVAPTVFGETDSTSGIWKFKSPSTTWGTNGFHLKYENSGNLGLDSSGQSSTFTVAGNLKQALDTPSNVFNTLNPLVPIPSGFSITQGNLSFAASTGQWQGNVTTLAPTQGKWYYECKYTTGVGIKLDIMRQSANDLRHMADNNTSYGAYSSDGYGYQQNNSGTDYYCSNNSCTTWNSSRGNATRIYMVCIDLDNGKYWIGADGTWYNKTGTANPATGADPLHSFSAKLNGDPFYITLSAEVAGSTHHANFGNGYYGTTAVATNSGNGYSDANSQGKFSYQPPSGYYALNTKNLNTYG